jgi:hypothetical protein
LHPKHFPQRKSIVPPLPSRLLLLALLPLTVAANQPASTTFRPALLESYNLTFGHTARSDLSRQGTTAGNVAVEHTAFSLTGRTPLGASTLLLHGLAYASHELDSGTAPLPGRLTETTLSLGLWHKLDESWTLAAYLRPGNYSDRSRLDGNSFNAPLLFTALYRANPELDWVAGFSVNAFSDNPFIPIAGVRWQFAPDWTLNLGFPRAGVTWRANERFSLMAGATVQGGSYRITRNYGVPAAGVNRLANTFLDYREIRLGLGAEISLTPALKLVADAGVSADQRFDYFDRGYRLKGDRAAFLALALQGRF